MKVELEMSLSPITIPGKTSQMFATDGAVLPKSSANQLLTLSMIDVYECQHSIGKYGEIVTG